MEEIVGQHKEQVTQQLNESKEQIQQLQKAVEGVEAKAVTTDGQLDSILALLQQQAANTAVKPDDTEERKHKAPRVA
eukprot:14494439-Alexandrium_andersonii.AAC.1